MHYSLYIRFRYARYVNRYYFHCEYPYSLPVILVALVRNMSHLPSVLCWVLVPDFFLPNQNLSIRYLIYFIFRTRLITIVSCVRSHQIQSHGSSILIWLPYVAWHSTDISMGIRLPPMFIQRIHTLIARFMGPTLGPRGADRTQVGPMLAPWTLLSG